MVKSSPYISVLCNFASMRGHVRVGSNVQVMKVEVRYTSNKTWGSEGPLKLHFLKYQNNMEMHFTLVKIQKPPIPLSDPKGPWDGVSEYH